MWSYGQAVISLRDIFNMAHLPGPGVFGFLPLGVSALISLLINRCTE